MHCGKPKADTKWIRYGCRDLDILKRGLPYGNAERQTRRPGHKIFPWRLGSFKHVEASFATWVCRWAKPKPRRPHNILWVSVASTCLQKVIA